MSIVDSRPPRLTDTPNQTAGRFGTTTLTLLVIANMIGAGVFVTSGYSLESLGSPHRVMIAWAVGGLIACCGAYCYGQLSRHLPESGGEYVFLARTVHPLAGCIAGWVSMIAGFTAAIALAATTLESYVVPPTHRPVWLPEDSVAIAAVVLAGIAHSLSPNFGARIQNVSVILKLSILSVLLIMAIFCWRGLANVAGTESVSMAAAISTEVAGRNVVNWPAFAVSLVWISLSYSGFNAAVYVAGEARHPFRTIPRALLLGTCVATGIYMLLNGLFLYATPPGAIAGRPDIAAMTAEHLGGSTGRLLVQLVVGLALWTSVLSMLMAAPRVYAKMADDGQLPGMLRMRDTRPLVATLLQVLLAIAIIKLSSLSDLLGYMGLTLSLSAAATAACLYQRQFKQTTLQRIPITIYVASTVLLGVVFAWSEKWQFVAVLATLLFGAIMYGVSQLAPSPDAKPEST